MAGHLWGELRGRRLAAERPPAAPSVYQNTGSWEPQPLFVKQLLPNVAKELVVMQGILHGNPEGVARIPDHEDKVNEQLLTRGLRNSSTPQDRNGYHK